MIVIAAAVVCLGVGQFIWTQRIQKEGREREMYCLMAGVLHGIALDILLWAFALTIN